MSGSLSEIRPGVWKVRVYVGTERGREQAKSRTFPAKNRREAERLMHTHVAAILADRDKRAATRGTVAGLVDDWWAEHQSTASPTTLYRERPIVDRIRQHLGPIELHDLTAEDVERFYGWLRRTKFRGHGHHAARTLSESTVHHHYRVLSAILNTGERWGRLERVVTRHGAKPKARRQRVRPPEADDLLTLLLDAGPSWSVVFVTLAHTGLRRGELCHLRWSDLRGGVLWVSGSVAQVHGELIDKTTKGGDAREVELDEPTQVLLAGWRSTLEETARQAGHKLHARARMFPNLDVDPRGLAPTKPDTISQAWRRLCDRHGVEVRLHDLRHWHASWLLEHGVGLARVQTQLGHKQMATTANIYGHTVGEAGRIAEVMASSLQLPAPVPLPGQSS